MILEWRPASERPDLLADTVRTALGSLPDSSAVRAAAIDPDLADTAAFCARLRVLDDDLG